MSRFNFRKDKPSVTPEIPKTPEELLQDSIKKHKSEALSNRALQALYTGCFALFGYGYYDIATTVADTEETNIGDTLGISFIAGAAVASLFIAIQAGSKARIEEGVVSQITAQLELNRINSLPNTIQQPASTD